MIQRSAGLLALGVVGSQGAPPSYAQHGQDWAMGICGSRDAQSPVNFDTRLVDPPVATFEFHYPIVNNTSIARRDGSLQANLLPLEGQLLHDGSVYRLVRMLWHSEAEHLIRGKRYPLELQLVHSKRLDPKKLLVVSMLFEVKGSPTLVLSSPPDGTPPPPNDSEENFNPDIQAFWSAVEDSEMTIDDFDLGTLLETPQLGQTEATFIEYAGSQTSPPCMDGVTWLVKRDILSAGKTQVEAMAQTLHALNGGNGNFRSVAPLRGRRLRVFRLLRRDSNLTAAHERGFLPLGPNPRNDDEFRAQGWANKAAETAEQAQDYLTDFRARMLRAAKAHRDMLS